MHKQCHTDASAHKRLRTMRDGVHERQHAQATTHMNSNAHKHQLTPKTARANNCAHEYHLLVLLMHILNCFDIVASLSSPLCVLKPSSDPNQTSASLVDVTKKIKS